MIKSLAPIILFVYNRPWQTEQMLEALKGNEFADQSTLYIYSDGPKKNASDHDLKKIQDVRAFIRKKKWCKEVIIIERDKNLGLADSVITGVTEVIEQHEKVIVLEDDIVTGRYFLKFMNEGLEMYSLNEKVYGISGYCFPYSGNIKEETFFLPIMSSWGYGTWKDRWQKINFKGNELLKEIQDKRFEKEFDFSNFKFLQMLKNQVYGKNNSWAVRFYATMFLNNGVFLFPNQSFLQNIGFDGTGIHCGYDASKIHSGKYENDLNLLVQKRMIFVKPGILQKFKKDKAIKTSLGLKLKAKIRNSIAPELIQLARRKVGRKNQNDQSEFPRYTETTVGLEERKIVIPDMASYQFMYKEIFEQEIYKFSSKNTEPYIIDGGANIGLATIYLKKKYPGAEIVAFEPDPQIFKILKSNIETFRFNNIKLVQKGLWDKEAQLDFWSEGADAGLFSELDNRSERSYSIKTTSLKPFLSKPVDFLKMDIEGAETRVLRDIKNELANVDRIFVEYHSFFGQPQTLNEIIDILTEAGYRLHISSPGLKSKSPFTKLNIYNNMDMQLNIYGFKETLN